MFYGIGGLFFKNFSPNRSRHIVLSIFLQRVAVLQGLVKVTICTSHHRVQSLHFCHPREVESFFYTWRTSHYEKILNEPSQDCVQFREERQKTDHGRYSILHLHQNEYHQQDCTCLGDTHELTHHLFHQNCIYHHVHL